eukprot:TRINITY_DN214_c0_g3_i3.p1 TRINITY_DN214_c0_g3~~TRINITY_DN214_c0_g3_i3.p1  ORF type:complete len:339 (-),score=70.65 TRINITY_DN214_c0_g3_i3:451-1467(-)
MLYPLENPVASTVPAEAAGVEEGKVDEVVDGARMPWNELTSPIVSKILSVLTVPDVFRAARVCTLWEEVVDSYSVVNRIQTRCFHTRCSYTEDILGCGLVGKFKNRNLSLHSDLLSQSAFRDENVRTSVWGQTFTHFLPLAINKGHSATSLSHINSLFEDISGVPSDQRTDKKYVLPLIIQLLENSLVLNRARDESQSRTPSRYNRSAQRAKKIKSSFKIGSVENTLNTACFVSHILLLYANEYPEIREEANRIVGEFVSMHKRKSQPPHSLGMYILLSLITDDEYSMENIRQYVVGEWLRQIYRSLSGDDPLLTRSPNDNEQNVSMRRLNRMCERVF